jgi:hypothetical protein
MEGTSWEKFRQHFNLGHAGWDETLPFRQLGPDVQLAYRLFHERLHFTKRDLNHEHSPV